MPKSAGFQGLTGAGGKGQGKSAVASVAWLVAASVGVKIVPTEAIGGSSGVIVAPLEDQFVMLSL